MLGFGQHVLFVEKGCPGSELLVKRGEAGEFRFMTSVNPVVLDSGQAFELSRALSLACNDLKLGVVYRVISRLVDLQKVTDRDVLNVELGEIANLLRKLS